MLEGVWLQRHANSRIDLSSSIQLCASSRQVGRVRHKQLRPSITEYVGMSFSSIFGPTQCPITNGPTQTVQYQPSHGCGRIYAICKRKMAETKDGVDYR